MVFLSCPKAKTHAKMNFNSSCFETQVSDKTKFSALSVFLKLFLIDIFLLRNRISGQQSSMF
jgi:hypothetical protein